MSDDDQTVPAWEDRPELPVRRGLDPWLPTVHVPGLLHDPYGDKWARHAGGKRDPAADREVCDAIKREMRGEYDSDGTFQPSAWRPA